MTRESSNPATFDCPHCGAPVAENARMCRACGADDSSGWGEPSYDDGYEDDFDYDSFVAREFPDEESPRPSGGKSWTKFVMLLVVISMLLSLLMF